MAYKTLDHFVGNTPLVQLQRMAGKTSNTILLKLEGNNPAGSVKDRPAYSMISRAEARGDIKPGDTLIEATSGNTGIALAMVAAMRGYKMILVMPENQSIERRQSMTAYGAELILTPKDGSMELARDVAMKLQAEGEGEGTHRTGAIEIDCDTLRADEGAHHRTADEAGAIAQARAETIAAEGAEPAPEAALPLPAGQSSQAHIRRHRLHRR